MIPVFILLDYLASSVCVLGQNKMGGVQAEGFITSPVRPSGNVSLGMAGSEEVGT